MTQPTKHNLRFVWYLPKKFCLGYNRTFDRHVNFSSDKDSSISGDICKFEVEDCKFWTWEPDENMCRFKGSDSGYLKRNGTVSGQVCCPREVGGVCCPGAHPPTWGTQHENTAFFCWCLLSGLCYWSKYACLLLSLPTCFLVISNKFTYTDS